MSRPGTECSTHARMFPVEWPLTSKTVVSSVHRTKHIGNSKGIKKRKAKSHRRHLVTKQQRPRRERATTTEQGTQTEVGEKHDARETRVHSTRKTHVNSARETHVGSDKMEAGTTDESIGVTNDIIGEPAIPWDAVGNIFQCLDRDEATWLADEVHQANKDVFRVDTTTEKLKNKDASIEQTKASLNTLKNLLKDLRWNIKYPDAQTAKDLDTLDDVSNNFGVRNIVNYLGLVDGYFSQLQSQLEK